MSVQAFEPSNQADFLFVVEAFGIMATSPAIEVSGESTDVFDGGARDPYVLGGRPTTKDFETARPFSRSRELPLFRKYLPLVNAVYLGCNLYPTDHQGLRSGDYFTGQALLKGLFLPATDSGTQTNPAPPVITLRLKVAKWSVAS